jgi:hypothetical protein
MIFLRRPGTDAPLLVDVTAFAIANVELVAHDRPIHGMGAIGQLAVDDGMGAEVLGEHGRTTSVPARAMAILSIHAEIVRYPYGNVWRASGPQR